MTKQRRYRQDPIELDFEELFSSPGGIARDDFEALLPRLVSLRDEVGRHDVELWESGHDIPLEKQPLDAGFIPLPQRLLADYETHRSDSELGRILQVATELSERVDRVVLLGIGGSYMGARALMDACCPPYYNELPPGERAGRPRLYFEGNNVDNDATAGLLHLLQMPAGSTPDWAIIVISKSGGTLETAVALRQFIRALQEGGVDGEELGRRIVPVTGPGSKLSRLADALGCPHRFPVPDGVGGRFSVLSAVGLLPAALLGLDIVALLQGAVAMNQRFLETDPADNPVLQYVAIGHLMEQQRGATIRVTNVWSKALESLGLWYDQLLAESLGKEGIGATPLTAVNTRDLHSRAQQHQEGRPDKFHTHVVVENWRTDPLEVGTIGTNEDGLDALSTVTLPQIMAAAIDGTREAYREAGRPGCVLRLPELREYSLGQVFQFWMLATVVEGRLLGINPYGQPGVEAYKRNMNRILGRSG